jgi:riboflavin kinase/FMN adenylyltransferase
VVEAARQLGRRYGFGGTVVTGDGVGRTLGCPTANLRLPEEKFLPADGIYAAWARVAGEAEVRAAAVSIGLRPTFGEQARALEVHLLDWSGELVGRELSVELEDWMRAQLKFDSPAALAEAIQSDLRLIRARLDAVSARH